MDLSAIAVLYQDSPEKETLIWYLRKLGMDHVLFGSDFPVFTSEKTLAAIRQYGLSKRVNSSSPAMEIEKWPVQSQQLTDVKRTLGYATQPYFHARWCAVKAHDVWPRDGPPLRAQTSQGRSSTLRNGVTFLPLVLLRCALLCRMSEMQMLRT